MTYWGIFGHRHLRPYGGFWLPFLGGAIGIGRRGPWIKFSGARFLRQRRLSLRRGFTRLGMSLVGLWLVFWTFAYVLKPVASENAPPLPTLTLSANLVLIAVAILFLRWIISRFHAK
jgi:hypothetical protein